MIKDFWSFVAQESASVRIVFCVVIGFPIIENQAPKYLNDWELSITFNISLLKVIILSLEIVLVARIDLVELTLIIAKL